MKPLHIALIIIAGLGVAAVVSLYGNTTKYVSFSEAQELSQNNDQKDENLCVRVFGFNFHILTFNHCVENIKVFTSKQQFLK